MTTNNDLKRGLAFDGYSKPLQEGNIRKGGTNPVKSQIEVRPAAPAPMRPASPRDGATGQNAR